MAYRATDIAEYIINKYNVIGVPITNLLLQKILYYVQGYSLAELDRKMFKEEIRAWRYGPVVKEVYDKYSCYAALPIVKKSNFELNEEIEKNIIREVFLEKITKSVWELVEDTHNEDPWKYTYEIGGEGSIIPCKVIKEYFKGMLER